MPVGLSLEQRAVRRYLGQDAAALDLLKWHQSGATVVALTVSGPDAQGRLVSRGQALDPLTLAVPGAAGLLGSVCVLVGILQGNSPFVVKMPDAWFYGTGVNPGTAATSSTFLGIMVVYAGVALMVGSWLEIVRTVRRQPQASLRPVRLIAVAWAVPIFVMPPLFSRDVYSYAAQGEMVARGYNPYIHGPSVLGSGRFLALVDPLWAHAPAPYGPAWERLSGGIVQLARHDVLATIVGFRLVALVGVVLIAWGVPLLARSSGRDPAAAFAVAVLNPLVLLVLLGGAHNDALMLGLLVTACALARRNHFVVALALCALAAEVKIPALIGAGFIGWWWSGVHSTWRRRIPRAALALVAVVGLMGASSEACGLGWRWLGALSNPGVVVSWLDPATAVGLALSRAAGLLGLSGHAAGFVDVSRAVSVGLAAVLSFVLLVRARQIGSPQGLGWSLLAFVVLGPVIWPWYESWGFVFLAVVAEAWTLRIVLVFSALACFADVPAARFFGTDPSLAVICWTLLLGGVIAFASLRLVPSLPRPIVPARRPGVRARTVR